MTSSPPLNAPALRVGSQRDVLGECPLWDERTGTLWWIDIRAPAVRRLDPPSGEVRSWPLPELVGSIALTTDPSLLLVALSTRIALFDPATNRLQTLAESGFTNPDHRFNDGRCDRQGRFWVGSMNNITRAPEGRLYRFDRAGSLQEVAAGICIPNSLAFSPDGRTLYFADSLQHRIDAYAYAPESGRLGSRRVLAHIAPPAFPDGSCIDADGFLWNAEFHGGRLARHAPDGRLDRIVDLPVQRPTCCTFGGPDFRTLYVTSTSQRMTAAELDAEPLAGALLALDVGVRGLPEPRFVI